MRASRLAVLLALLRQRPIAFLKRCPAAPTNFDRIIAWPTTATASRKAARWSTLS